MKILTYEFEEPSPRWKSSQIELSNLNLLAGLSGVGKTRILNTIHNLSLMIKKKRFLSRGKWKIQFLLNDEKYDYTLIIGQNKKSKKPVVVGEYLLRGSEEIIWRDKRRFTLLGTKLPKLSMEDIGLFLLREDSRIKKIFDGFSKIYIRRTNPKFIGHNKEDGKADFGILAEQDLATAKDRFTVEHIHEEVVFLNIQLFLLKEFHEKVFSAIASDFKEIFPFVKKLEMKNASEIKGIDPLPLPPNSFVPMPVVKEKGVRGDIHLLSISSGMLKALVQLVDIYTMPKDSIYLIDELENGMGVKSLPIMIEILKGKSKNIQIIFTTHHPYIFNNIDLRYWKVLSRKGSGVNVIDGKTLKERFSKSHQDAFTQLINSELIEDGI